MKAVLIMVLVLAASAASAKPNKKACPPLPSDYSFSQPMTVEEIERVELKQIILALELRPDIPKVPFGFSNPDWVAFKSLIRPGDKVVAFSSSRHSWKHQAGHSGYALIRAGCWVHTLTLAVS